MEEDFVKGINEGQGLVGMMDHGSKTGLGMGWSNFSNDDIPRLTNYWKNPVVLTMACNTSQFPGSDCLGEAWLKADSTGGTAYVGATVVSGSAHTGMDVLSRIIESTLLVPRLGVAFNSVGMGLYDDYFVLLGDPAIKFDRAYLGREQLYVDGNYGGVGDGSANRPFSSINDAWKYASSMYKPMTLIVAPGEYVLDNMPSGFGLSLVSRDGPLKTTLRVVGGHHIGRGSSLIGFTILTREGNLSMESEYAHSDIRMENNVFPDPVYIVTDDIVSSIDMCNNVFLQRADIWMADRRGDAVLRFKNNIFTDQGSVRFVTRHWAESPVDGGIEVGNNSFKTSKTGGNYWYAKEGNMAAGTYKSAPRDIYGDPVFADPANGDYRTASNSPCQGTGDPSVYKDQGLEKVNIGLFENNDQFIPKQPYADELLGVSPDKADSVLMRTYSFQGYQPKFVVIKPADGEPVEVYVPEGADVVSAEFSADGQYVGVLRSHGNRTDYFGKTYMTHSYQVLDRQGNEVQLFDSYDIAHRYNIETVSMSGDMELKVKYRQIQRDESYGPGAYVWGDQQAPDSVTTDVPVIAQKPLQVEAINYPNPFSGQTTLKYTLPESGSVEISIFDINGRRVGVLSDPSSVYFPGTYEAEWNAVGAKDGMYFAVIHFKDTHGNVTAKVVKMMVAGQGSSGIGLSGVTYSILDPVFFGTLAGKLAVKVAAFFAKLTAPKQKSGVEIKRAAAVPLIGWTLKKIGWLVLGLLTTVLTLLPGKLAAQVTQAVMPKGGEGWVSFQSGATALQTPEISFESVPGEASLKVNIPGVSVKNDTSATGVVRQIASFAGEGMGTAITRLVAVPQDTKMEDLELKAIAQDSLRFASPEFYSGGEHAPAGAVYAGNYARINGIETIRDQKVVSLTIYPMHYKDGEYKVYDQMTVSLSYPQGQIGVPMGSMDGAMGNVLNLQEPAQKQSNLKSAAVGQVGTVSYPSDLKSKNNSADYIMIVPSDFVNSPSIKKLADYRSEADSFNMAIVNTADIYSQFPSDSLDVSIRNFVNYAYSNWKAPRMSDGHTGYVLLLGDAPDHGRQVDPSFHMPTHWKRIVDNEYPAYDGWFTIRPDGSVPSTPLGRITFDNESQLAAVINKTIRYETDQRDWKHNVLQINGFTGNEKHSFQNLTRYPYKLTNTLSAKADYQASPSKIEEDFVGGVNEGQGFVGMMDHGNKDKIGMFHGKENFTIDDVSKLTNYWKTPVVLTLACNTAQFSGSDCLGEAWLKADSTGGVAYVGATVVTSGRGGVDVLGKITSSTLSVPRLGVVFNSLGYAVYDDDYTLLGDPALKFDRASLMGDRIYVDGRYGGVENGSANQPFRSINEAWTSALLARRPMTLVVAPGEYVLNPSDRYTGFYFVLVSRDGPLKTTLRIDRGARLSPGSAFIGFTIVYEGEAHVDINAWNATKDRRPVRMENNIFPKAVDFTIGTMNFDVDLCNNVFLEGASISIDWKDEGGTLRCKNNIFANRSLMKFVAAYFGGEDPGWKNIEVGRNLFQTPKVDSTYQYLKEDASYVKEHNPKADLYKSDSTDIYGDPIFADPANGDYRTAPNSPCKGTGDPSIYKDKELEKVNIGLFENNDQFIDKQPYTDELLGVSPDKADSVFMRTYSFQGYQPKFVVIKPADGEPVEVYVPEGADVVSAEFSADGQYVGVLRSHGNRTDYFGKTYMTHSYQVLDREGNEVQLLDAYDIAHRYNMETASFSGDGKNTEIGITSVYRVITRDERYGPGAYVWGAAEEHIDSAVEPTGQTSEIPDLPTISVPVKLEAINYPNPFSGQTTLKYTLPAAGEVDIFIFDMQGRRVGVLSDRSSVYFAGPHEAQWNAAGAKDGMYFAVIRFTDSKGNVTAKVVKMMVAGQGSRVGKGVILKLPESWKSNSFGKFFTGLYENLIAPLGEEFFFTAMVSYAFPGSFAAFFISRLVFIAAHALRAPPAGQKPYTFAEKFAVPILVSVLSLGAYFIPLEFFSSFFSQIPVFGLLMVRLGAQSAGLFAAAGISHIFANVMTPILNRFFNGRIQKAVMGHRKSKPDAVQRDLFTQPVNKADLEQKLGKAVSASDVNTIVDAALDTYPNKIAGEIKLLDGKIEVLGKKAQQNFKSGLKPAEMMDRTNFVELQREKTLRGYWNGLSQNSITSNGLADMIGFLVEQHKEQSSSRATQSRAAFLRAPLVKELERLYLIEKQNKAEPVRYRYVDELGLDKQGVPGKIASLYLSARIGQLDSDHRAKLEAALDYLSPKIGNIDIGTVKTNAFYELVVEAMRALPYGDIKERDKDFLQAVTDELVMNIALLRLFGEKGTALLASQLLPGEVGDTVVPGARDILAWSKEENNGVRRHITKIALSDATVRYLAPSRQQKATSARPEGVALENKGTSKVKDVEGILETYRKEPMPLVIRGAVQNYDWGGRDFIPALIRADNSSQKPFAELWVGAHPKAPAVSSIEGVDVNLKELIDSAGEKVLGPEVFKRFAGLPYLMKVLDARDMLSIQAHPSKKQAEEGFARENRAGVPVSAENRNYKDDNHKPEVHVAQTDFWMLHSFRPLEEIASVLNSVPEFRGIMPEFGERLAQSGSDGKARERLLRELYEKMMTMPQEDVDAALNPLLARIEPAYQAGKLDKDLPDFWAAKAALTFPLSNGHRDRGIFSVYVLNLLHLKPGQATFQPAGCLHAYLEGVNMELMANSDNVMRGGLTPKLVDVPELLRTLEFKSGKPEVMNGVQASPTERVYATPAEEFQISEIKVSKGVLHRSGTDHSADSLIVLKAEEGKPARIECAGRTFLLNRGDIFLAPYGMDYVISSDGEAVIYRASVPNLKDSATLNSASLFGPVFKSGLNDIGLAPIYETPILYGLLSAFGSVWVAAGIFAAAHAVIRWMVRANEIKKADGVSFLTALGRTFVSKEFLRSLAGDVLILGVSLLFLAPFSGLDSTNLIGTIQSPEFLSAALLSWFFHLNFNVLTASLKQLFPNVSWLHPAALAPKGEERKKEIADRDAIGKTAKDLSVGWWSIQYAMRLVWDRYGIENRELPVSLLGKISGKYKGFHDRGELAPEELRRNLAMLACGAVDPEMVGELGKTFSLSREEKNFLQDVYNARGNRGVLDGFQDGTDLGDEEVQMALEIPLSPIREKAKMALAEPDAPDWTLIGELLASGDLPSIQTGLFLISNAPELNREEIENAGIVRLLQGENFKGLLLRRALDSALYRIDEGVSRTRDANILSRIRDAAYMNVLQPLLSLTPWRTEKIQPEFTWRVRAFREIEGRLREKFGDAFIGFTIYGSMSKGYVASESDVDYTLFADDVAVEAEFRRMLPEYSLNPCVTTMRDDLNVGYLDPKTLSLPELKFEDVEAVGTLFQGIYFGPRDTLRAVQKKALEKLDPDQWNSIVSSAYREASQNGKLEARVDMPFLPADKETISLMRALDQTPLSYEETRSQLGIQPEQKEGPRAVPETAPASKMVSRYLAAADPADYTLPRSEWWNAWRHHDGRWGHDLVFKAPYLTSTHSILGKIAYILLPFPASYEMRSHEHTRQAPMDIMIAELGKGSRPGTSQDVNEDLMASIDQYTEEYGSSGWQIHFTNDPKLFIAANPELRVVTINAGAVRYSGPTDTKEYSDFRSHLRYNLAKVGQAIRDREREIREQESKRKKSLKNPLAGLIKNGRVRSVGSAAERIAEGLSKTREWAINNAAGFSAYDTNLETEIKTGKGVGLSLAYVPGRKDYEELLPLPENEQDRVNKQDVDAPHPDGEDLFCKLIRQDSREFFDAATGPTGLKYRLGIALKEYAAGQMMVVAEDPISNVFNDADRLRDMLLLTAARGAGYETWTNAQGGGASKGTHWHFLSAKKGQPLWKAIDQKQLKFASVRKAGKDVEYGELKGDYPARVFLYRGKDVEQLIKAVSGDLNDLYAKNIPPALQVRALEDGTFEVAVTPLVWDRVPDTEWLTSDAGAARPKMTSPSGTRELSGGVVAIYSALPEKGLTEAQKTLAADRFAEAMRGTSNWTWQPAWQDAGLRSAPALPYVRLSDDEVREYFGDGILEECKRTGKTFYLKSLTYEKDSVYIDAWRNEINQDREWNRLWNRNIKLERPITVRDTMYSKLPHFALSKEDNVGLVSIENGRERLEGFIGLLFIKDEESQANTLYEQSIELYYRNIGMKKVGYQAQLPRVADLLSDYVLKYFKEKLAAEGNWQAITSKPVSTGGRVSAGRQNMKKLENSRYFGILSGPIAQEYESRKLDRKFNSIQSAQPENTSIAWSSVPEAAGARSAFSQRLGKVLLITFGAIAGIAVLYWMGGLDWYVAVKSVIPQDVWFFLPAALLDAATGVIISTLTDIVGQYLNFEKLRWKQTAIVGASGVVGGFGNHTLSNLSDLIGSPWLKVAVLGAGSLLLLGAYIVTVWWARGVSGRKDDAGTIQGKAAKSVIAKAGLFTVSLLILLSPLSQAVTVIALQVWGFFTTSIIAWIMNKNPAPSEPKVTTPEADRPVQERVTKIIPKSNESGKFADVMPASYAGENATISDIIKKAEESYEQYKKGNDRDDLLLAGDFAIQALNKAAFESNRFLFWQRTVNVSRLKEVLADFEKEASDATGVIKALADFIASNPSINGRNLREFQSKMDAVNRLNERTELALRIIKHQPGYDLFGNIAGLEAVFFNQGVSKEKYQLMWDFYIDHLRNIFQVVQSRIADRKTDKYDRALPTMSVSEAAEWRRLLVEIVNKHEGTELGRTIGKQGAFYNRFSEIRMLTQFDLLPLITGKFFKGTVDLKYEAENVLKDVAKEEGLSPDVIKLSFVPSDGDFKMLGEFHMMNEVIKVLMSNSVLVAKERLEDENEARAQQGLAPLTLADRPIQVTMSLQKDKDGSLSLQLVEVSDNVGGISDPEMLKETRPGSGRQNITEKNTSRRRKDTGFGLAYVWNVVNIHGGTFWMRNIDDKPGKGIIASIRLPMVQSPETSVPTFAGKAKAKSNSGSVLNVMFRSVVRFFLKKTVLFSMVLIMGLMTVLYSQPIMTGVTLLTIENAGEGEVRKIPDANQFMKNPEVISAFHCPVPLDNIGMAVQNQADWEVASADPIMSSQKVRNVIRGYEEETHEQVPAQVQSNLELFYQLNRDPSASRAKVSALHQRIRSDLGKSYGAGYGLSLNYASGFSGSEHFNLLWRLRELNSSAIKPLLPAGMQVSLSPAIDYLSGRRPWGREVEQAMRQISKGFEADPSLIETVKQEYDDFVKQETLRLSRLTKEYFGSTQALRDRNWMALNGIVLENDTNNAVSDLQVILLGRIFESMPPERYRGLTVDFAEGEHPVYNHGADRLYFSLSGYIESFRFVVPSGSLWDELIEIVTHELSHRWDYQLPRGIRNQFYSISWNPENVIALNPPKPVPGVIYLDSRKAGSDISTDFVIDEDQMNGWTVASEDIANLPMQLSNPKTALTEVKRAVYGLRIGRPQLARKMSFGYSFWGRIPDVNAPWIVKTDGLPLDDIYGTYVYRDDQGNLTQVNIQEGKEPAFTSIHGDFDPNQYVLQTPFNAEVTVADTAVRKRNGKVDSAVPAQKSWGTGVLSVEENGKGWILWTILGCVGTALLIGWRLKSSQSGSSQAATLKKRSPKLTGLVRSFRTRTAVTVATVLLSVMSVFHSSSLFAGNLAGQGLDVPGADADTAGLGLAWILLALLGGGGTAATLFATWREHRSSHAADREPKITFNPSSMAADGYHFQNAVGVVPIQRYRDLKKGISNGVLDGLPYADEKLRADLRNTVLELLDNAWRETNRVEKDVMGRVWFHPNERVVHVILRQNRISDKHWRTLFSNREYFQENGPAAFLDARPARLWRADRGAGLKSFFTLSQGTPAMLQYRRLWERSMETHLYVELSGRPSEGPKSEPRKDWVKDSSSVVSSEFWRSMPFREKILSLAAWFGQRQRERTTPAMQKLSLNAAESRLVPPSGTGGASQVQFSGVNLKPGLASGVRMMASPVSVSYFGNGAVAVSVPAGAMQLIGGDDGGSPLAGQFRNGLAEIVSGKADAAWRFAAMVKGVLSAGTLRLLFRFSALLENARNFAARTVLNILKRNPAAQTSKADDVEAGMKEVAEAVGNMDGLRAVMEEKDSQLTEQVRGGFVSDAMEKVSSVWNNDSAAPELVILHLDEILRPNGQALEAPEAVKNIVGRMARQETSSRKIFFGVVMAPGTPFEPSDLASVAVSLGISRDRVLFGVQTPEEAMRNVQNNAKGYTVRLVTSRPNDWSAWKDLIQGGTVLFQFLDVGLKVTIKGMQGLADQIQQMLDAGTLDKDRVRIDKNTRDITIEGTDLDLESGEELLKTEEVYNKQA